FNSLEISRSATRGGCRVEQQRHSCEPRRQLLEKFDPLGPHRGVEICESGSISAWRRQGHCQAAPNRIRDRCKYDWNYAGRTCKRLGAGACESHEDVWPRCHQLCCKSLETLGVTTRPTVFNLNIRAFPPSQVFQLLLKYGDAYLAFRVVIKE